MAVLLPYTKRRLMHDGIGQLTGAERKCIQLDLDACRNDIGLLLLFERVQKHETTCHFSTV